MSLRRRSDKPMSAQDLFSEVVHMPMQLPGATMRLERDSLIDQRQRPATGETGIGELYHENSKLFPAMASGLRASRVDADGLRRDFVNRRSALPRGAQPDWHSSPIERILSRAVVGLGPQHFYSIQLRVGHAGALGLYEPLSGTFETTRHLCDADWSEVSAALDVLGPRPPMPSAEATVFISASLARNEILLGQRAYRRTLIEVGQVVQQLIVSAAIERAWCRPNLEFTDRVVDEMLDLDGLEESVFAVLEIGGIDAG